MSKKVKAGEEEIQRKRKSVAAEKPEEEKEVKEVVEKTTPAKKGKGKKDVATPPAQKKQKKEEKEEEPEEEEEKEESEEEEEEEKEEEDESNENKAFVWGLPETFNEEKLGELFKDCKVLAVKVPANRMDAAKCKGFGFVTFESAEEMTKALTKFEGRNVEGREIHLKQAEGKKEDAVSKTKVFVYGVGTDATEESVTALFKKCGSIVDVHIPKSREDETKAKGFAFVTFETEEAVKKCMEMNGKEVNGVALSIKTAAPRQSRPTRGRGRGGFRGGFRGGRGSSSEGRPAGGRGGFRGRGRGGFRGGRGRGSSRGSR